MSDSKFTPGPWRVQNAADHVSVVCETQQVAVMRKFPELDTRFANARLIAAAPQLYAAISDEIEALEVWQRATLINGAEVKEGIAISLTKLRAALTAATKESQP